MKLFFRHSALLLSLLLASSGMAACGSSAEELPAFQDHMEGSPEESTAASDAAETAEAPPTFQDHLEDTDFAGAVFRILTIKNDNVHSYADVQAESGDVFDDAIYQRNRKIEERFNIRFEERFEEDDMGAVPIRTLILAGDDAYEMGGLRCTNALTFWEEHMIYSISELPNIDLSAPYWAEKLNASLSLGGSQYVAVGAYDVNVLDLTYALLFNKQMAQSYDFESPYTLVQNGTWTIDRMYQMMTQSTADLNGDGEMDDTDQWGYLAFSKQILPDFWIAAGEMSILKDENDLPRCNMTAERFGSVISRVFEITHDAGTWYSGYAPDGDVPSDNIRIFSEGRALFLDSSLYHIKALRGMETDFGILPYPKFDEAQNDYYSRVTYYWANAVPVTNTHLEMTGTIIEALNCGSANLVIPAYYDIALKSKYSRDEESLAMLDLIQENRVVDLGDTIFCDEIRDGFVKQLFETNNRNFASLAAKREKRIQKILSKLPIWD